MAYLQRWFIPVSRYVKVIKIHQDFPELWSQMHCHLFYGSQCILRLSLPYGGLSPKQSGWSAPGSITTRSSAGAENVHSCTH